MCWRFVITWDVIAIGSVVSCGNPPCPPLPRMVSENMSAAAIAGPTVTAAWPLSMVERR